MNLNALCALLQDSASPKQPSSKSLYSEFQSLLLQRNYNQSFEALQKFLDCTLKDKKDFPLISFYCCLHHWYFEEYESALDYCCEGLRTARSVDNDLLIDKFKRCFSFNGSLQQALRNREGVPLEELFEPKICWQLEKALGEEEKKIQEIESSILAGDFVKAMLEIKNCIFKYPKNQKFREIQKRLIELLIRR